MKLEVELFSFLPNIDIVGEDLQWQDETSSLTYRVQGKDKQSQWKVLYADDDLVAAESSVTGLNVIQRIK